MYIRLSTTYLGHSTVSQLDFVELDFNVTLLHCLHYSSWASGSLAEKANQMELSLTYGSNVVWRSCWVGAGSPSAHMFPTATTPPNNIRAF